jgi:hypothetical protein
VVEVLGLSILPSSLSWPAAIVAAAAALVGCAGQGTATSSAPASSNTADPTVTLPAKPERSPSPAAAVTPATATSTITVRPDAAAIFARLKPGLTQCYEQEKKATPAMIEGKLTLNASIDASGKATCVIPTEDTGLTQEVEDCMSARLEAVAFDRTPAPWTIAVPVLVRSSVVQLGDIKTADKIGFDTVETHRMANAFEKLEAIEPSLTACVRGIDKSAGVRSLLLGARVATDGRNVCAMASSPSTLPASVSDCLVGVLRSTTFPPPKGGPGLILIPMNLTR